MKYRLSLTLVLAAGLALSSYNFLIAADAEPVDLSTPDVTKALNVLTPDKLHAHIRFLADDRLEGREAGTRGYDLAADYVAGQFKSLGLRPAGDGDSFFQKITFRTTRIQDASLAIVRDGKKNNLAFSDDFVAIGSSLKKKASVKAPVAFVGYGVSAPSHGYDDYAGIDAKGKIVVIVSGAPRKLPGDLRSHLASRSSKSANAAAHGAVGVITVLGPEFRFPWERFRRFVGRSITWVGPDGIPGNHQPGIEGLAILNKEVSQQLFASAPATLEEALKSLQSGKPNSFPLPIEIELSTSSTHEDFESSNVAAVFPGSDPALRGEYIIYSAHLDHIGINQRAEGDKINNGAYDNASGSAAILEVARAFTSLPQPPRRSVLFLAVTAEEKGLLGSDYYARHPTVPKKNIVANINMDMFLMIYPIKDMVAFGSEHSSLGKVMEQAMNFVGLELSPDPMPEQNLFTRSDHYSFVKQGVPSVFLITGFKSADPKMDGEKMFRNWLRTIYHKPTDDLSQKMHLESGVKVVQANFLAGYIIANQDERPSWNPGNFFGETFGHLAR